MAKQGSYAIRVWRFHKLGLERVLDLQLAARKVPDVPIEVCRGHGPQPLQGMGEPGVEAGAHHRELPLDGGFGERIRGDSKRLRGTLQVTERFLIPKTKRKGAATHENSLHLSVWTPQWTFSSRPFRAGARPRSPGM